MTRQIQQLTNENLMRKIKIEKVVISCGSTGANLEKSKKLLELISGMKAQILRSKKRIPNFDVSPGLEVGTKVTLRGSKALELLKRFLASIDNTLSENQISTNHFQANLLQFPDSNLFFFLNLIDF